MEQELSADAIGSRFRRLMEAVLDGHINRTNFGRWEIDLLIDLDACSRDRKGRRRLLQRYRRAALKALDRGAATPPKMSEYLAQRGPQATLKM